MHFQEEIARRANLGPEAPSPVEFLTRRRTPRKDATSPETPTDGAEMEHCVLIVEDEADSAEALSELLADEGFKSQQARNGQEALELLRSGARPSLILLDIKMPVMDGKEFLRQVSSDPELAEIPVAVMTASATRGDVLFRKRNAGFFRKPVDHERLLTAIRFYCG